MPLVPGASVTEAESAELPHKYVGGDPSVDFVNTVDWTARGLVDERLGDYARLTHWAEGAGVVPAALGAALRATAEARPHAAAEALVAAHRLRGVLQRVFAAAAAGHPLDAELATLAPFLSAAAGRRVLAPAPPLPDDAGGDDAGGAVALWTWHDADADLASPLWPVAWGAADLLASVDAARLRVCGAPDCGWVYVDRSRNGMRRWCQMGVCGTRAKSRRRAERTADRQRRPA